MKVCTAYARTHPDFDYDLSFKEPFALSTCSSRSKSCIKLHRSFNASCIFTGSKPISSAMPLKMRPVWRLDSAMRCERGRQTLSYVLRTCSTSSGDLICSKSVPRTTASSRAVAAPLPCHGVMACAASPAIHTRPFVYVGALVCSYCANTAGLSWSSRSCTCRQQPYEGCD
jgi:hypothetical protein